ncbi:MAG: DUF3313 family protein [Woeseiaceae bacterium]
MQTTVQLSVIRTTIIGLAAMAFVGCTASTPTLDTSPEAEMTFDGLYPVKGGRMDEAWARADFDIESYSKVLMQDVGIEYRPGGESRRRSALSTRSSHYEVTTAQKERFESLLREVFLDELAKGDHFELVAEPGPDVLLIRAGLLDVVSFVPPDPLGNADVYLSRVGEATLVLEMRDSVSDAILVRAVDRRAAEDIGGSFTVSNRVTNSAEVRRLARHWATGLRQGLDRFMAPDDEAGE